MGGSQRFRIRAEAVERSSTLDTATSDKESSIDHGSTDVSIFYEHPVEATVNRRDWSITYSSRYNLLVQGDLPGLTDTCAIVARPAWYVPLSKRGQRLLHSTKTVLIKIIRWMSASVFVL